MGNSSAAAAAAIMFGQFPFPLSLPPPSGPPNDWIFANLAATAAALNHPMGGGMNPFQKFNFQSMIPTTSIPNQPVPKSPPSHHETEASNEEDDDEDDNHLDVIGGHDDTTPKPSVSK